VQRYVTDTLSLRRVNRFVKSAANKGFTLIELVVTITVAAILAAVAIPSMGNFISQTRLSGNVNEFIAATMLARSEAVQRSGAVTICRSTNAETQASPVCDTSSTDWTSGWIVYVGTTLTTPSSTNILARQGAFPTGTSIAAALTSITYNATGAPVAVPQSSFAFTFNSQFSRLVCFDPSGRTTALQSGATVCP